MLKKLTIGLAITTIVLFITTLVIVPFAVKQQVNAFIGSEEINFNGKEFEIEATRPLYQIVFKSYSGIQLETSYDDKFHIDFQGISIGSPTVEASETDEKAVVLINRVISTNAHKLLGFIDYSQDVTIYVPSGVKVEILGDYYVHEANGEVDFTASNMSQYSQVHYGNGYDNNFYIYQQAARYNSGDNVETCIKKLSYIGYLIATDYAQGDINRPVYIDYTMKVKEDLIDKAKKFFNQKLDYNEGASNQLAQAGVNYVNKQMDLTYALELQHLNNNVDNAEEAQIIEDEDNYEVVVSDSTAIENKQRDLQIETLKDDVKNARNTLEASLASNGIIPAEADFILDLFKM